MRTEDARAAALIALVLAGGCRFAVGPLAIEAADGSSAADLAVVPGDRDLGDDFGGALDLAAPADGALPGLGAPCQTDAECDSGLCVDGVCCDQRCDPSDPAALCRACNVPGFVGRCAPVLDGTDPRGQCELSSPGCGGDGLCDGKGACRPVAVGTVCGVASCSGGMLFAPPSCDGAGRCLPSTNSGSCGPYACDPSGGACLTHCSSASDCVGGATCSSGGVCSGKSALGQPCGSPSECQGNQCWQGVCCASDCNGSCRSCALPGALGLCLFAAAGTDPLGQCVAATSDSCGLDGQCDGFGSCRPWSASTACAPRSCSGDSTVSPRLCDGAGTCLAGVPASCAPYGCDAASGSCFASCSSDAQCAGGRTCKRSGKCK